MIAINKALLLALAFLPAQTTAICENRSTFNWFHGDKERTCKHIRINEELRTELCMETTVKAACPQTCGSCCEDDSTYAFKTKKGIREGSCQWVAQNHRRIAEYCVKYKTNSFSGRSIRDACPVTCGFCFTDEL